MRDKDVDELAKSVGVIVEKILKLMLREKNKEPAEENQPEEVQQKDSVEE
ncbi:MAG: hypothetical protein GY861_25280 [bacterium]|nr:hypothetical protein [bacterium]